MVKNIGKIGENLAKTFLMKQGYKYLESNFRSYFGEIDHVFTRNGKYHFIEVKAISLNSLHPDSKRHIDPRDNYTRRKNDRLLKTIEFYCINRGVEDENWQLDLVCVYVDMSTRQGRVEILENVEIA